MPELEGQAWAMPRCDLLRMASGAAEAKPPNKGQWLHLYRTEETDLRASKLDIVHALSSDRLARAPL
ncbi:hypothetical protein [Candidatus Aalborgicola defluviihabitans]|uniref:hypothetical protein n=1 Tax=Candidatus Aalborgicola defluviihabitans TaxID=3386187 RepID=UPI001ED02803|nr:hypothetical protein [Burkholderiales bacterium]